MAAFNLLPKSAITNDVTARGHVVKA